jgi:outer membrane protein OmpA-like peptidoglycan-associated protein
MLRAPRRAPGAVAAATVLAAATPAAADPFAYGGWLGPHFFSDDASLGFIPTAAQDAKLENGVVVGGRISYAIFPWLVPEFELPLVLTSTDLRDVGVLWMQPRAHVRFEFQPKARRVQPFVLAGAGATFAISGNTDVYANDVTGDGYFGIGAHAITGRGFQIRGDIRFAVAPGVQKTAVLEFEAGIGLWVPLGGVKRYQYVDPDTGEPPEDKDPDRDGFSGTDDKCPDRPEDEDGHDDRDGCPDIDNDLDRVLDIADKCPSTSESMNGFEDDDGCPEALPDELDELDGTIEGLTYDPGETSAGRGGRRALKKIAAVMKKYPSIRITLIGHTDDREAAPRSDDPPAEGEAPPEPAALAVELSIERAAVLKAILVGNGIGEGRVTVEGKGAEDPVGDNDKRRGRQANRRVVLKRAVPPP